MSTIDLTPMQKAVARLAEGLTAHQAEPTNALLRDGLIQRFEFTYDLTAKILRRVLAARSDSPPEIDRMSFPTLMRTAFEQGYVGETWPIWLDFRKNRNVTSHTYDETLAGQVAAAIPPFLTHVRALLERLQEQDTDGA